MAKRCDGMVCLKALFCEFRGLMRTQSGGWIPGWDSNSTFVYTEDCQPLGRRGWSFWLTSPTQDEVFQLYFKMFHITLYFSDLFWWGTLHVSDRSTVHHQESQHCVHSKGYLYMRLMYSELFWPLNRLLATRRTLRQTVYLLVCFNVQGLDTK